MAFKEGLGASAMTPAPPPTYLKNISFLVVFLAKWQNLRQNVRNKTGIDA